MFSGSSQIRAAPGGSGFTKEYRYRYLPVSNTVLIFVTKVSYFCAGSTPSLRRPPRCSWVRTRRPWPRGGPSGCRLSAVREHSGGSLGMQIRDAPGFPVSKQAGYPANHVATTNIRPDIQCRYLYQTKSVSDAFPSSAQGVF